MYRIWDEIAAKYSINDQGWNSLHNSYNVVRNKKLRIAVVGDSFVDGLQVPLGLHFADILEQRHAQNVEVYRFGLSGAPLSQYLQMIRKEVVKYSPDLVIIPLIHNDFDESYNLMLGRYTTSFLRLKFNDDLSIGEIPPKKYKLPWYTLLRGSATYRYLVDRYQFPIGSIKHMIFRSHLSTYSMPIHVDTKGHTEMFYNEAATDYIFSALKKISIKEGFKIILLMNADMYDVYGLHIKHNHGLELNRMAAILAKKYNLSFIDLNIPMKHFYQLTHQRVTYVHDGHWNPTGHELIANILDKSGYLKLLHQ